jgi:signal transduction histidine kinase
MVEIQMQRKLILEHPELVEFFSSAEEEVARLLRMVESFLILTRARIHQRLETVADVSLETVLVRAVQDASKLARARDVRIVPQFLSGEGDSEPVVYGDGDLLATAFQNLLSNAVRYSSKGQTVWVQARVTSQHVEVKVRDRGPGIPEEHHPHIFDMFYQVSTSSGGGTAGVGLAIVKTVVELHGGTVAVRNAEGGGCEFTVRLPLRAKPAPRALQTTES